MTMFAVLEGDRNLEMRAPRHMLHRRFGKIPTRYPKSPDVPFPQEVQIALDHTESPLPPLIDAYRVIAPGSGSPGGVVDGDVAELLGRSFLRRAGHLVASTTRDTAKVVKDTVMIPTQLALHPTPAGFRRAGRRTVDTASTAVRSTAHVALESTRITVDVAKAVGSKIKAAVEKLARKMAHELLFKKASPGAVHGDDTGNEKGILKYDRSGAKSYLTPLVVTAATALGASIGSAFPAFGTAAGGAAGGTVGAVVTPPIIDSIYNAFDKKKKSLMDSGMSEREAAEKAALFAESESGGFGNLGIGLAAVGIVAALALIFKKRK